MICTRGELFAQVASLIQANSVHNALVGLTAFPGEGWEITLVGKVKKIISRTGSRCILELWAQSILFRTSTAFVTINFLVVVVLISARAVPKRTVRAVPSNSVAHGVLPTSNTEKPAICRNTIDCQPTHDIQIGYI